MAVCGDVVYASKLYLLLDGGSSGGLCSMSMQLLTALFLISLSSSFASRITRLVWRLLYGRISNVTAARVILQCDDACCYVVATIGT